MGGLCWIQGHLLRRIVGELGAMPHGHHPDDIILDPIEESIGSNDDFAVMTLRKFRERTPGVGIIAEAQKNRLGFSSKSNRRGRFVAADIIQTAQKLIASRRGEDYLHG